MRPGDLLFHPNLLEQEKFSNTLRALLHQFYVIQTPELDSSYFIYLISFQQGRGSQVCSTLQSYHCVHFMGSTSPFWPWYLRIFNSLTFKFFFKYMYSAEFLNNLGCTKPISIARYSTAIVASPIYTPQVFYWTMALSYHFCVNGYLYLLQWTPVS